MEGGENGRVWEVEGGIFFGQRAIFMRWEVSGTANVLWNSWGDACQERNWPWDESGMLAEAAVSLAVWSREEFPCAMESEGF